MNFNWNDWTDASTVERCGTEDLSFFINKYFSLNRSSTLSSENIFLLASLDDTVRLIVVADRSCVSLETTKSCHLT